MIGEKSTSKGRASVFGATRQYFQRRSSCEQPFRNYA